MCVIYNEGVSKVKADSANNKLSVTRTLEAERGERKSCIQNQEEGGGCAHVPRESRKEAQRGI